MLKKWKVYAKLILVIGAALIIFMVVLMNRQRSASVWFFHDYDQINVLWLMLCTATGSILSWWLLGATRGLLRDLREARRDAEVRRREQESLERTRQLDERERRVDQKPKKAIGEEP